MSVDAQMSRRAYIITTGLIFFIIACLHLLRLITGWEAVFEGWAVPKWPSFAALLVAGYLAYEGCRLSRK